MRQLSPLARQGMAASLAPTMRPLNQMFDRVLAMPEVGESAKRTIDALAKAGLRERVKVMIGGAPVSQAFADEIGADGYAKDSTLAVLKAKELAGVEARAGAAR